jgi:hypothetical protein
MAVEHRHSKDHSRTLFACLVVFAQNGPLTIELGLPVQIRRLGRGVRFVWSFSLSSGEDVVRRYVNKEDVPRRSQAGKGFARRDVQGLGPLGVIFDLVRESLCSTYITPLAMVPYGMRLAHSVR